MDIVDCLFDPWYGAWIQLATDPRWRDVPVCDRRPVVAAAITEGRKALTQLESGAHGLGPLAMAATLGIHIQVEENGPGVSASMARRPRAEWWPRQRLIRVFTWSLEEVRRHDPAVQALELHIAHELFHVLHPARRLVVMLPGPGRRRRRVALAAATEVAAHVFAAGWLGLEWYPGALDSLHALRTGILDVERLGCLLVEAERVRL